MKVEVPSTLSKIRIELYGFNQGQEIGPNEALCVEIPWRALEHLHNYLKSGLASNKEALWSFQDIITFLRGEIGKAERHWLATSQIDAHSWIERKNTSLVQVLL